MQGEGRGTPWMGDQMPGFKAWLCHSLAGDTGESHALSQSFSSLIWKVGAVTDRPHRAEVK